MKLEWVRELGTWDSGGGQVIDILTLKVGRVLAISADAVVLYSSMDDLEEGEPQKRQAIIL